MSQFYSNLDSRIRRYMLDEVAYDEEKESLYLSQHLSRAGQRDFPELLKEAILHYDDSWFAEQLRRKNRIISENSGDNGHAVPITAPISMAEEAFERYYARAMCLLALTTHRDLVIFRAQPVHHFSLEAEFKIGALVDPYILLDSLRVQRDLDRALGLPSGPRSGLGVRLANFSVEDLAYDRNSSINTSNKIA